MYDFGENGEILRHDLVIIIIEVVVTQKMAKDLYLKRTGDKNSLEVKHVINSHPIIYVHLKLLFHSILQHGYVPPDFKEGMIIPVLKNKIKDNRGIENYRPIIIISMLSKIFEMCLNKRMCCKLQADDQINSN